MAAPRVVATLGVAMLFFGGINFAIGFSLLGERGTRNRQKVAELLELQGDKAPR